MIERLFIPRKVLRILVLLACAYGLYVFLFGVLIFAGPRQVSEDYQAQSSIESYYGAPDRWSVDRVALIEFPNDAAFVRLQMIEFATKSLDVSYYTTHWGETTEIFFALLQEAADRGVKVRIILDGIFHNVKGKAGAIIDAFAIHPNIELSLYEPLKLLRPATFNNRLHDKYIIVDDMLLLLGGRNIGDKYFDPESYQGKVTNDRDVLVVNTAAETASSTESVLSEAKDYFERIWQSPFAQPSHKKDSQRSRAKGDAIVATLRASLDNLRSRRAELFVQDHNYWMERTVPTHKISLVHNPLTAGKKEPWCGYEIAQLLLSAEQSVLMQSPYVIPNKRVMDVINAIGASGVQFDLLTNSMFSSPNFPAFSGYLAHRKRLVDSGLTIFEYHGTGSIHAKSYLLDGTLSMVGSFNLDDRSAYLSTETMLIIHSEPFYELLSTQIHSAMEESFAVGEDYEYHNPSGKEIPRPSGLKSLTMHALSYVTRFFGFML